MIYEERQEVECKSGVLVSSDARRDIHEVAFAESAFQEFIVRDVTNPLGQHFHKEKFEVFYFLEGGGTIRTAEVDPYGRITGEVKSFAVASGSAIKIPPWHTHRFDLVPDTRFIAFSSKPFDPNDMTSCPIKV